MKDFQWAITSISEVTQVGKNSMNKQEFVLKEVEWEYPQSMAITLLGDKTSLLEGKAVGDIVKAHLNFKANEYNGRNFTNINAWKIDMVQKGNWKAPEAKTAEDNLPF